jgi:hypothetical protein
MLQRRYLAKAINNKLPHYRPQLNRLHADRFTDLWHGFPFAIQDFGCLHPYHPSE